MITNVNILMIVVKQHLSTIGVGVTVRHLLHIFMQRFTVTDNCLDRVSEQAGTSQNLFSFSFISVILVCHNNAKIFHVLFIYVHI